MTTGPETVCPVLGLPGRINSTCLKGSHTLAQAQQTLEPRSVYQTGHCLNQDVVAFVTRGMQMSFPGIRHPAPHLNPSGDTANGGCPENRREPQKHRKRKSPELTGLALQTLCRNISQIVQLQTIHPSKRRPF